MKLFATSDLHGNLAGLDPQGADLVIVAGDIAPTYGFGYWHVHKQQRWIERHFIPWCASYDAKFCVIPGNHDLFADPSKQGGQPIAWPDNVSFLNHDVADILGLRIIGTPWVPHINGRWAFESLDGEEEDLYRRFSILPDEADILVSHTPPKVPGSDIDKSLQTDSPHFGSRALLSAGIYRIKPRYNFCGHIHSGDHAPLAVRRPNGTETLCYNVSRLDERYEVAYAPLVIDI